MLKGVCYDCWNKYIELLLQRSNKVANFYKKSYRQRTVDRLKTNVFSHSIKGRDWTLATYDDCGKINMLQAEK